MKGEIPNFGKVKKDINGFARKTALIAAVGIPTIAGGVACDADNYASNNVIIISGDKIPENRLGSEKNDDTQSYPYKIVVPTSPYTSGENAVEFYSNNAPTYNGNEIKVSGIVFCPEDTNGKSVGCDNRNDTYRENMTFIPHTGGMVVLERDIQNKEIPKDSDSYEYKTRVTVGSGYDPETVTVYSHEEPIREPANGITLITINNAYCPEDDYNKESHLGCGDDDRVFKSMRLMGSTGSVVISKNEEFKSN